MELRASAGTASVGKFWYGQAKEGNLQEEMIMEVDVKNNIEIIKDTVVSVRDVIYCSN